MHAKKITCCDTQVKDPVVRVQFSGLRKYQNNPACAKLTVVRVLKLDTTPKKRRCFVVFYVAVLAKKNGRQSQLDAKNVIECICFSAPS